MHRVCWLVVVASFFVSAHVIAAPPAQKTKRIAVLTLTAPWTPKCRGSAWRDDKVLVERCSVLDTLADEARSGAVSALRGRPFTVMTRENTALLLKENGGGSACTEGECEVETAKLIGADEVVSGTVTFVEGTWFVTLKLHDVASANLLDTAKVKGATQVSLIEAIAGAAEGLVQRGLGLGQGSTSTPAPAVASPSPVRPSPRTTPVPAGSLPDPGVAYASHGELCEKGDGAACVRAGYALKKNDPAAAARLLARGCELGQGMGCYHLAWMLHEGSGVPIDRRAAAGWYVRGCDLGSLEGCSGAGFALAYGQGVPADPRRALPLLERACAATNHIPRACAALGDVLEQRISPPDLSRALEAYHRGCSLGDGGCCTDEQKLAARLPSH
jgi:hypothetical protein